LTTTTCHLQGKLVLYFASKAVGYDHTKCGYNNIQDQFAPDCM